jgi:hypothetical protein
VRGTAYDGFGALRLLYFAPISLVEWNDVSLPEWPVVAEGEGTQGERWFLRAGGSPEDYSSMIETVHPGGRRDEGGMGGPALYPGQLLNVYVGRADQGPLRVVVRADPRVQRLCFRSELGEQCDMLHYSAHDSDVGLNLFAILLPWTTGVAAMRGLDPEGRVLTD